MLSSLASYPITIELSLTAFAFAPIAIDFVPVAPLLSAFSVSVEFIETYLVFAPAVTFLSWATLTASVSFVPAATLFICLVNPASSLPTDTPARFPCQVETNFLLSNIFLFFVAVRAEISSFF